MRWLFLAAILSFLFHGLFLTLHFDWIKESRVIKSKHQTIAVELSYKKPERPSFVLKTHPVQKPTEKGKNPSQKIEKITSKPIPLETKPVHAETPTQTEAQSIRKESSNDLSGQDISAVQGDDNPERLPGASLQDTGKGISADYELREATPEYQKNPPPEYPRIARRKGYQGTVILEVLVDQNGRVEDLRIFQSSGYPSLDDAASASVFKWAFLPGMRENKPVDMWVKIPVRFQLQ